MEKMPLRDIKTVARYLGLSLLSKGFTVSPLKLQKMLYYTQAWYMVFFGRENTLFKDVPEAWVNGPVYPAIYREYKNKAGWVCDPLKVSDFGNGEVCDMLKGVAEELALAPDESKLVERIVVLYGALSQDQLIFMTHCENPWAEKREGLAPFEASQTPLSLDTMYSYYKKRHDLNRKMRNEKTSQY